MRPNLRPSLLLFALVTFAHAFQALGASEWDQIAAYVNKEAAATGGFDSSLSDAYYGSGAMQLLGKEGDMKGAQLCPLAESELGKAMLDLPSAYFASHMLSRARCAKAQGREAAERVARQALEKEAAHACTGYKALSILSALGKSASAVEIKNSLVPLVKHKTGKGRVKAGSKGLPSLMATACGYLAGAQAHSMGSLDSESSTGLEALVAGIPQVLESASRSSLWSDADDDPLEAVAMFLKGIDETCSSECTLSQHQLGEIAKQLLRVSDVGSLKDAYHTLEGIAALTGSGNLQIPALLSLKLAAVPIKEGVLAVDIADLKGKPVSAAHVKGSLVKGRKGSARELEFSAKGAGRYEASVPKEEMATGTHQLTVTATGKGGEKVASETFAIALVGSVEVPSAVLAVKRLDPASTKQKEELVYPQQLQKPLNLQPGTQLKVTFTPIWDPVPAKGFTPQQAFLSLKSKQSGKLVVVAAKAGKDGAYIASLTPEALANQIGAETGDFDATLSVADDGIAQALVWQLGPISVAHASAASPIASPSQLLNSLKPEIHHIFQAPGKRPPAAVSMAFTVLSVAPLGFLLIHLSKLGVNIKGLPSDGPAFLTTMAFHGGVAAILVLYFIFWVRLSLIDTLLPLLLLSLFTFYFGFLALKRLAKVECGQKQE